MIQAFLHKWTELSTNKWYLGSRTRKDSHPDDGYICSSKIVKPLIQNNPTNWKRDVIIIATPEVIRKLEVKYLSLMNAAKDVMSYNRHNGADKFAGRAKGYKCSDIVKANMRASIQGHIVTEATREKLRKANLGKKHSPESIAKMSKSTKGQVMSAAIKAKISATKRANPYICSDETKAKLNAAGLKRWNNNVRPTE